MIGAPAFERREHAQAHPALGGELERVRQQVLEHLLQALGVGDDAPVEIGRDLHLELEAAVVRLVAERPRHAFEEVGEDDLFGVDGDRAGLDLGQVEDVGDQVQEVGAGAVNGPGELHLLVGQVAAGVLLQLLT